MFLIEEVKNQKTLLREGLQAGDTITIMPLHGLVGMGRHGSRILPNIRNPDDNKILLQSMDDITADAVASLMAGAAGLNAVKRKEQSTEEVLFYDLVESTTTAD